MFDSDGLYDDFAIHKALDEGRKEDARRLIAEGDARANAELGILHGVIDKMDKEQSSKKRNSFFDFLSKLFR